MGLLRFTLCKTGKKRKLAQTTKCLSQQALPVFRSKQGKGDTDPLPNVSPSARLLCSHEFYITVYVETAQKYG